MKSLTDSAKTITTNLLVSTTFSVFVAGIYCASLSVASSEAYTTTPAFAQLASNLPDIDGAMPFDEIVAIKDQLPLGAGIMLVPAAKPGHKFYCTAKFPAAVELASSDAKNPFSITSSGDIIVNRKVIRYAIIVLLSRNASIIDIEKNSKCLKTVGEIK